MYDAESPGSQSLNNWWWQMEILLYCKWLNNKGKSRVTWISSPDFLLGNGDSDVTGACGSFCPQNLTIFLPFYFCLKSQTLLAICSSHKEVICYCIFSCSSHHPSLKGKALIFFLQKDDSNFFLLFFNLLCRWCSKIHYGCCHFPFQFHIHK